VCIDERLQLNPGAETMLARLQKHGIKTLLGIGRLPVLYRTAQAETGTGLHPCQHAGDRGREAHRPVCWARFSTRRARPNWLVKIREELKLKPGRSSRWATAANDLKMMAQAGISIAYHAKPVGARAAAATR